MMLHISALTLMSFRFLCVLDFEKLSPSEQTEYWKAKMLQSVTQRIENGEESDDTFFDDEFYHDVDFPEDEVLSPLRQKQQAQGKGNVNQVNSTKAAGKPVQQVERNQAPKPTSKPVQTESAEVSDDDAPELDFAKIFGHSKLTRVFTSPPAERSLFTRMVERKPMYFSGTRRLVSPDGVLNESSQVYLARAIDKSTNMMTDRMVNFDYENEAPYEQEVVTHVNPKTGQAHVIDMDDSNGKVRSRTFIQLRGEPWAWHSAAAMTRLEFSSTPIKGALPITVSRLRFDEDSIVNERIITQDGQTQLIIIDEMSEVTETQFNTKIIKMFEDYQKKMAEEMEEDAQSFAQYEKQNGKIVDSEDDFDLSKMTNSLGGGMGGMGGMGGQPGPRTSGRNARPAMKKGGRRD